MGVGASNVPARLAASVGLLGAVAPQFQPAVDVPHGGVLMALPALLAMGLLDNADALLDMPQGYYGLDNILLLPAFMALARIESIESLRHSPPGEWGKLLGLDRVPEARTLREKVAVLSRNGKAEPWGASLCEGWMEDHPDAAGTLYVDGHVRVYHGGQTKLPRHYVARQKLCLRASADYWVNAGDGQPFFVVNRVVDPGLIEVIEQDILPRLEKDVPNQPDEAMLEAKPLIHRFTLVFDREGYSPDLLLRLKTKRIACLTYHKHPEPDWSLDEFHPHEVTLVSGHIVEMQLAERGVCLSNKLWVRQIRKLTESGHQTPILATDYVSDLAWLAAAMFARWSQENFFKYCRNHYGLDRLIDYKTAEITDPILVVNPAYRKLDGQVRSTNGKLSRAMADFGALSSGQTIEAERMEPFIQKKAALQEKIEDMQTTLATLKKNRKETVRHIKVQDLPEEERFRQLSVYGKQFVDTIKMAAYRAETAMANCLHNIMPRPNEAHTLLRALYTSEADLLPDYLQQTLTVCLHHSARHNSDRVIHALCEELNATETTFPRTHLRMVFKLGAEQNR
jgi:prepilin-type processing-associated H-X9-DG protein